MTSQFPRPRPHFPAHHQPRTWLITSAACPIGIALTRAVLAHGDNVVLGVEASDLSNGLALSLGNNGPGKSTGNKRALFAASNGAGPPSERAEEFEQFIKEEIESCGWRERCRTVGLDGRIIGLCQAAVAEAVAAFDQIDILFCCTSEAVIGTVEELAASQRSLTLVREQFETNFFGPVNIIKAALPAMREKKSGHIMILTGITSHLGTPGLGIYCAAGWAIEGFCDSLAYEIAPFNIKMTILQPNLEVNVLTNKISAAPLLPAYSPDLHPAPLSRSIIGGLLDRISPPSSSPSSCYPHPPFSSTEKIEVVHPHLPADMKAALIAETVHALTAVGGHENPPARHIVGFEGVASVKEKLKTVSEELEDFVECSAAVDIEEGGDAVGEGEGAG